MVKVSVIVPVYNTEKYLPQCLDSLIHQTLEDLEIIVVDDESTDHTPEIIREYAKKDKRIKAIFKKNGGCGDTYNAGLAQAKGEYIGFLEADDWAEPNMFEVLYKTAKNTNVDIVRASGIFWTWEDHEIPHTFIPPDKCNRIITDSLDIKNFVIAHMCHWSSLYKHEFIVQNNILFPGKPKMCCPDFEWAYHCWLTAKSFYVVPARFVHYRQDNVNAVQNSKRKHHMQVYNGHLQARNMMKSLGKKVTPEHWRVKSCVEAVHFIGSIDANPFPPYEYIRKISQIFKENLRNNSFSKEEIGLHYFNSSLFIAKYPLLYWINSIVKFWFEQHQKDGQTIYWRFFGLYKKIERQKMKKRYLFGILLPRRLGKVNYHIELKYSLSKNELNLFCKDGEETRVPATSYLIQLAMKKAVPFIKHDFKLRVYTHDFIMQDKERILAYSGFGKKVTLIPDFSFVAWPQCHIFDYDSCCKEILHASQFKPKYNQLFWIGNVQTNPIRNKLIEISKKDNRIKAISMNWKRYNDKFKNDADVYVSLPDHCQYKYLIDLYGFGYSARTKFLMFSGRPLFLQERGCVEYWYKWIRPFVHFIPVKEDLSDLTEKLNWAEAHPKECAQIAKNAQMFAVNNLTRDAAIDYLKNVIIDYANGGQSIKKLWL